MFNFRFGFGLRCIESRSTYNNTPHSFRLARLELEHISMPKR